MKQCALKRSPVFRRGRPRRRAAAIVEFAIVLPVLMTILFGIMEFGHLFKVRLTAQQAAREGCRTAVLQSTQKPYSATGGKVMTRITEIMTAAGVPFTPGMVSIQEDTLEDPAVEVIITVPYSEVTLTGFLGALAADIKGTCSMRKEGV
jgi:Flp pilus assembly protein TadG